MAAASWLKYAYLAHFSQPRTQRQLFRLVKFHKICRIVEVGIFSLERTAAMIAVAQRFAGTNPVNYTGLDWFDARDAEFPKLTLKDTHRQLQATGATIRLVPGEPARSVGAIANSHPSTGLLLLSSPVAESSLAPAWFYFPRMVDGKSIVLRERIDAANRPAFELLKNSLLVKQAAALGERKAA
ncbi:MAG: hypothetical protein AB7G28_21605 [Pirellulales bacterium]